MGRRAGALVVTLLCAALPGCATTHYYWQAVRGHLELMRERKPIAELVADPATPPRLRDTLQQVQQMRRFAVTDLGLPDNDSYRSYAALGRPYVLWNVFAAPALSITPREWCFPIAGCVAYRGYFSHDDAEAQAARLQRDGDDAYVGGVPAYSTLGWMNDPVLSTYIAWPEPDLARLLFHELAHQEAYAAGDTAFNEAFATAVEEEGVARWIRHRASATLDAAWQASQQHRQGFFALVMTARQDLGEIYASAAPAAERLAAKRARIARLLEQYQQLKAQWGGFTGFDRWFTPAINNAQLASIAVYTALVPAFQQLLREQGGDLPAFYRQVRRLAAMDDGARQAALDAALRRASASAPAPAPG